MLERDDLAALLSAFEGTGQPAAGLAEIARIAERTVGHQLCTVMVLHRSTMQVQRLYSSRPDVYPVGGRKEKRDTAWGRQVLDRAQPYLGRNARDIEQHFNDHETIAALGLASILNLPVVYDGVVLGTLNMLHEAGHYHERDIGIARPLTSALLPLLCRLQEASKD